MTLDDLRRNRNLLFWVLQTVGWSAYVIVQYVGALLYDKPGSYIKVLVIAGVSGFLLTIPLRYFYRWLWVRQPLTILIMVPVAAWVTALVWRVFINLSFDHYMEPWLHEEPWYAIFGYALPLDLPAAALVRTLFRHQALRGTAAAARGHAARPRRSPRRRRSRCCATS